MSTQDGKLTSTTYFDVYCDHILDAILKHGWSGKQKYFDTFTLKQVIRVKKTRGASAPRTRITCKLFGKPKNAVCI